MKNSINKKTLTDRKRHLSASGQPQADMLKGLRISLSKSGNPLAGAGKGISLTGKLIEKWLI